MSSLTPSSVHACLRPAETRPGTKGKRAGFALLITITLLAFLVLLLVSLASLTRVETQVASNNQTLAQARQNALFAVNLALGQLQKYTGPDRRVTARADITTVGDKLTRVSGEPVVTDIKNPLWTGVWDSSKWEPLTGKYDGAMRGRTKPDPMTWLVSGNEDAATPRKYTPAAALPASSATTPKQVLVNGVAADGSVDAANPRVEAPVVAIESDNIPGMSGKQAVGHYAWWVGDEGVKARLSQVAPVSVADSGKPSTPSSSGAELYYWKAMSPARAGGELAGAGAANRYFPDFNGVFAATTTGEVLRASLRSVVDSNQLPLMPVASSGNAVIPNVAFRRNAPSFTTVSRGVLADTVRGGLRLDLTRYLETGQTDGAFNANDSIYADAALSGGRQPAFALLKSWYDIGRNLSGGGFNAGAGVQPETISGGVITGQGLFPVITRYQIGYAAMSAGPGAAFTLLIHPSVVLWNPHNVSISATDLVLELEEDMAMRFMAFAGVTGSGAEAADVATVQYLTSSTEGTSYKYGAVRLASLGLSTAGNPAIFRMRIPGVQMAPGEVLVFSLKGGAGDSTETAPLPGSPAASFPEMAPIWNDRAFLKVDTGLTLNTTPIPATMSLWCRVGSDALSPYRYKARLYKQSDYATGQALQNLELAYTTGASGTHDPANTQNDPGYSLTGAPPLDSTAYRTTGVVMRTPYDSSSSVASGTAMYAPAVPYGIFNVRGAYGVNTSFERSSQFYAGDPFFRAFGSKSLPTPPLDPDLVADRDRGFTGPADTSRSGPAGQTQGNYSVFFDYPRAETAVSGNASHPVVMSLGEFQHADLSSNALNATYAFGNSWPDPRIGRESVAGRWSGFPAPAADQAVFSSNDYLLRDTSYLANHALWDRFFLSTIPQGTANAPFDATTVLPNTRLRPVAGMIAGKPGYPDLSDVRNTRTAAGSLLLDGAFNINSTSVDAWRALLGGLADLTVPDAGWSQSGVPSGSTATPAARGLRHLYSRFLLPRSAAFDQTSFAAGTTNGMLSRAAWTGARYLTDAEIDTLARNIVEEVKVRGPFMSLADFVNRRLITAGDDDALTATNDLTKHRLKVGALGALQKALLNLPDVAQGLNAALNQPAVASVNNFTYTAGGSFTPRVPLETVSTSMGFRAMINYPSQLELLTGGLLGQLSYGAPGFLTQADVLQKIGATLAARSDTFVIRTYGDSVNPATGEIDARAWCEVVVQRLPEFVDSQQAPETVLASLNPLNRDFGRRYRMVSFRWLTPADL